MAGVPNLNKGQTFNFLEVRMAWQQHVQILARRRLTNQKLKAFSLFQLIEIIKAHALSLAYHMPL